MKALPIAMACWALAAAAAAAGAQVRIELRPEARPARPAVGLGDIARLESADLATLRRLVDLPLGRAPAAGNAALVARDDLAAWLQRRTGIRPEQVEWRGATQTRVLSAMQAIDASLITAAADRALRSWLADRTTRSEVELASSVRDIEAWQGELRLRARDPGAVSLRSRMTIWVDVWAGSSFVRAVPVTFSVSAWGEGAVLATALPAGAPLAEGPAARAEVDLLAGAAPLRDTEGLRTRRPVAAGEVLRKGATEALPAVERGAWAALQSGEGAVRTEARVQVLQDGRVGDQVRVRAPGAAASVLARVTGTGQLEVAR